MLTSVGMDIGSSGTQVIFSRLHMRRIGEDLTSRYIVVKRETLHESPVCLTPYRSDPRIDDAALGRHHRRGLWRGRLAPADIDTGVVILTGEALRRENARGIAEHPGRTGRRVRLRHRRPSHGSDACGLRIGRCARLA